MSAIQETVVGYVGLGIMGGAMATNLQRAGYPLVVHDLRPEAAGPHLAAGAKWAGSAQEVAERSDVIFSCLPSVAQIEAASLGPGGVLAGMTAGKAYFEMSTNTPELVRRMHAAFKEQGAFLLDAPISGGAGGARLGRLAIWVGGDKQVFARYEAVLRAMADCPIHVGPTGAGLVTKIVHNCTHQILQAGIAEVFAMGVKAGAEPLALWEAVRQGSIGRRRVFDGMIEEYLPAHYSPPNAALRIAHKDMQIATSFARELGVPMRFANLAMAELEEAMGRGWAERDSRSVMLLPQERAGIAIKADPADIRAVLERDPPAPTDTKFSGAG